LPYRFFLFDPEDSRQRSDRRVESDIGSYFGKTKSVAMDSPQRKMANKTGQVRQEKRTGQATDEELP
jgi:hypothetical protein